MPQRRILAQAEMAFATQTQTVKLYPTQGPPPKRGIGKRKAAWVLRRDPESWKRSQTVLFLERLADLSIFEGRYQTSSRYSRSSKSNNRSPRSKAEEEESFPFNLDEFVTVDEIVEEHIDPKKNAEEPDSARKGKRKENDSVTSDTKKSRLVSGESHVPSFVTLDEVGDEEESACAPESVADKTVQSLVTVDDMDAEDIPVITKEEQMLMTLDEISDDDEAQDASTVQHSSATPKTLNKGQTAATVAPKVEEPKLLQETKDAAVKGLQDPPTSRDEVKAEDDEELSFADIEHQFLTVDEIGEEEEESESKPQHGDSKSSKANVSDQSKASKPTTPARRGRPRKRPLPESAEGNKDSLNTSKGAEAKPTKDEKEATGGVQDHSATVTGKPADGKSGPEASAKKTKLETPTAEKTKLAPYNSSTAVETLGQVTGSSGGEIFQHLIDRFVTSRFYDWVHRHQRFLRFAIQGDHYQFMALPFGLASAPRVFTKVMAILRSKEILIISYLDDLLIKGPSCRDCDQSVQITLVHLGWIINREKVLPDPSSAPGVSGYEI
ncbi:unnamed protein product [Ranitomeya imitator]|uniref:Reverse transcriptase domain-containing protein n=1 Tax=Ranitomeya imitator TaxID=111125 RepID=A0ABN9LNS8_9NEOB|nr:unnamed protein product [Ranitomeya imitator]